NEMSNRYANTLLQMGVQKGERVGMLLYNSLEYFALYFAIARLGAIAVRINFRLVEEELEYILNDSGSTILCYDNKLSDRIADIKDNVPVREYICFSSNETTVPNWAHNWSVLLNGSATFTYYQDIHPSDPVMLMYTSGTTGRPKDRKSTRLNSSHVSISYA